MYKITQISGNPYRFRRARFPLLALPLPRFPLLTIDESSLVLDRVSTIILDCDGVLWTGSTQIEGLGHEIAVAHLHQVIHSPL